LKQEVTNYHMGRAGSYVGNATHLIAVYSNTQKER